MAPALCIRIATGDPLFFAAVRDIALALTLSADRFEGTLAEFELLVVDAATVDDLPALLHVDPMRTVLVTPDERAPAQEVAWWLPRRRLPYELDGIFRAYL